MNIYLLSQGVNMGYDTYDSCVVVAKSEDDARLIHPAALRRDNLSIYFNGKWVKETHGTWASQLAEVSVELIGKAKPGSDRGVVCASFNAG